MVASAFGGITLYEMYAPVSLIRDGERFQPLIFQIHVDTSITTKNPERFIPGYWQSLPGPLLWWWTVSGQMTQEGDEYTIQWSHHAGVLTTIGKNFIEGKLGNNGFANNTAYAEYITLSTSASAPAANWKEIPTEITADGLQRAVGAYASTGDGVWTISKQFTASGAHTDIQLTGLEWDGTLHDLALLCADTFTPVTLASGDKLTVTWTTTVT